MHTLTERTSVEQRGCHTQHAAHPRRTPLTGAKLDTLALSVGQHTHIHVHRQRHAPDAHKRRTASIARRKEHKLITVKHVTPETG